MDTTHYMARKTTCLFINLFFEVYCSLFLALMLKCNFEKLMP